MNHKVYILLLYFSALLCSVKVYSQDAHNSQFFSSPLSVNPANAGNFDASFRVTSNYRSQWADFNNAFTTGFITVEGFFLKNKLDESSKLSWGTILIDDASGNGLLTQQSLAFGVSYRKYLDGDLNHSLAVGFQGAYVRAGFNTSKADFEDELSSIGFNLTTQDVLLQQGLRKDGFDFSTGIQYVGYFSNKGLLHVGASAYHLNKYGLNFIDPAARTPIRYNINMGGYTSLNSNSYLHFSSQLQFQGIFKEFIYGAALELALPVTSNRYTAAYLGLWFRNQNFIIPYIGFEWNNARLGFTYDVGFLTRSAMSFAQYRTSEIALSWLLRKKGDITRLKCPKF